MKHKDKMTILAFFLGPLAYPVFGEWKKFLALAVFQFIVYFITKYMILPDILSTLLYFIINGFIIIDIRNLADKEEKELAELKRENEEHRQRFRKKMGYQ